MGALALVVMARQPDQKNGTVLQEVGYIIFVVVWLFIITLAALLFRRPLSQFSVNSKRVRTPHVYSQQWPKQKSFTLDHYMMQKVY